jgi:hypothetical protein
MKPGRARIEVAAWVVGVALAVSVVVVLVPVAVLDGGGRHPPSAVVSGAWYNFPQDPATDLRFVTQ